MTSAEDLSDLLQFSGKFGAGGRPDVKGPVGFHQGFIESWDAATGENAVRVLGTVVNDLPVLSVADSILLTEGDPVGILRFRQTYFILGRITPPGAPPRPVFEYRRDFTEGFDVPNTFTTLVSVDFTMPEWASEVTIIATGGGHVNNTSGLLDNLSYYIEIGGTPGNDSIDAVEGDYWTGMPCAFTVSGPVSPGTLITVEFRATAPRGWGFHASNEADISATAIYGNS